MLGLLRWHEMIENDTNKEHYDCSIDDKLVLILLCETLISICLCLQKERHRLREIDIRWWFLFRKFRCLGESGSKRKLCCTNLPFVCYEIALCWPLSGQSRRELIGDIIKRIFAYGWSYGWGLMNFSSLLIQIILLDARFVFNFRSAHKMLSKLLPIVYELTIKCFLTSQTKEFR